MPSCIGAGNYPLHPCPFLDAPFVQIASPIRLLHFWGVFNAGTKSRAFCLRVLRFRAALFASGECNRPRVIRATGGKHFVTRVPRSHREVCCDDRGLVHAPGGVTTGRLLPGTHGRRWGATTCLPPHDTHTTTAYTRQDATRTHTCRPRDGAARMASVILSTHFFCLRRLRLFMFNTSVITFTTAHLR